MWIARRGKRHRWTFPPPVEERPTSAGAQRDRESAHRLAEAFEQEDAAIAMRIGEDVMGEWKFKCKHCGSRFSLEMQRDIHESLCGRVNEKEEGPAMPGNGQRPIVCKYCGHESPSLKDHSAHLLAAHRKETLARRRELAAKRKADNKQTKAGAAAALPAKSPARAHTTHEAFPAQANAGAGPSHPGGNGHSAGHQSADSAGSLCPTCGGPVPKTTAEFVAAVQAEGLVESQAFAVAHIARKIFGPALAA